MLLLQKRQGDYFRGGMVFVQKKGRSSFLFRSISSGAKKIVNNNRSFKYPSNSFYITCKVRFCIPSEGINSSHLKRKIWRCFSSNGSSDKTSIS